MSSKQATRNNPSNVLEEHTAVDTILDQYIQELCEGSGAINAGKAFMKAANPWIRSRATNRARFAINAANSGKKPSDPGLQADLDNRMRQTPQMNPLTNPDSYGVLAAVSASVQNDPDMSAKVKRFYRAMVDNWVKSKLK
jgi:hypothetical protein